MKISELINEDLIIADLQGKTKKQVLEELVEQLARFKDSIDAEELLRVLLEREKLGSTGIGNGIAIPHGKLAGLNSIVLVFGKTSGGVDFEAIDGKPVNLIFLLVAPANSAGVHLKALARLSRLLKDVNFRQQLVKETGAKKLYKCIVGEDERITS